VNSTMAVLVVAKVIAVGPAVVAFVALMAVLVLAACLLLPQYGAAPDGHLPEGAACAVLRSESAPEHIPVRPFARRVPVPVSGRHAADPADSPRVGSAASDTRPRSAA
jgi:hypothetical protein